MNHKTVRLRMHHKLNYSSHHTIKVYPPRGTLLVWWSETENFQAPLTLYLSHLKYIYIYIYIYITLRGKNSGQQSRSNQFRTPVALFTFFWKRYESSFNDLKSITAVLQQVWLWHWITHQGLYAFKQINKTIIYW